jgi:hypothetical protein
VFPSCDCTIHSICFIQIQSLTPPPPFRCSHFRHSLPMRAAHVCDEQAVKDPQALNVHSRSRHVRALGGMCCLRVLRRVAVGARPLTNPQTYRWFHA